MLEKTLEAVIIDAFAIMINKIDDYCDEEEYADEKEEPAEKRRPSGDRLIFHLNLHLLFIHRRFQYSVKTDFRSRVSVHSKLHPARAIMVLYAHH